MLKQHTLPTDQLAEHDVSFMLGGGQRGVGRHAVLTLKIIVVRVGTNIE